MVDGKNTIIVLIYRQKRLDLVYFIYIKIFVTLELVQASVHICRIQCLVLSVLGDTKRNN
jgi:hypothetical protein